MSGRDDLTVAVLPIKRFRAAKARLGLDLSDGVRRALTEAMVTDVLIALRRAKRVDEVLVVTGETSAEALAAGYDATAVIDDPDDDGHSVAALRGIAVAIERGAARVVLVPGDCPALDPAELDRVIDRAPRSPGVTVVPDRHGTGTNALVLAPPDIITPAFGPGSRDRHVERAEAAGAAVEVMEVTSLGLDIDTVDDLEALRLALASVHGGASHTRGLLMRIARK